MARKIYPVSLAIASIALSINFGLIAGLPTQAQTESQETLKQGAIASITFEPPNGETLNDSAGGASRNGGFCPQDGMVQGPSVTPVIPHTQQGLTVSERPTFFVYVPKTSATQGYLIVKDNSEDYYYQTKVAIPNEGGIVAIALPDAAPGLEVDKTYQWSFVVACEEPLRADSPRVQGWIKRTEVNASSSQMGAGASLETANFYASEGIWYDALTTLAQLQQSQPEQYTATWQQFLSDAGLEAIATQSAISIAQ